MPHYNLPAVDPSTIPGNRTKKPPPLSGGKAVKVYRGFARNAQTHANQVVRDGETGGILSRDPDVAHDAIYNQVGRDPVLSGPEAAGVVEITIPADLWDELVQTLNIAERGSYPGFSRRLNTTEIRVNSLKAGQLINQCARKILPPNPRVDHRPKF